jgi:hypothetical protein
MYLQLEVTERLWRAIKLAICKCRRADKKALTFDAAMGYSPINA